MFFLYKKMGSDRARLLQTLVLSAIICVSAVSTNSAQGAPVATGGLPIGSVDMQKVVSSSSKRLAADDQFQQYQQQLADIYKTQTANPMLTTDQQRQLGSLLIKPDATPVDKQSIADLETKSQKDTQSLATLQQQKDLTDADKAQLQQLTTEQQAGTQALQDVADSYRQQLDAKNTELSGDVDADIRVAIAAVAKAQGLSIVFDSSVALYSANDITQLVIAKLKETKDQ